jgi:hypothetical protein
MFCSAALDGATEQLVKGLLTARYSCLLLATTLANNPSLIDQAALFLAQFLKVQADFSDAGPNSSLLQESTLTPTTAAAKTSSGLLLTDVTPVNLDYLSESLVVPIAPA